MTARHAPPDLAPLPRYVSIETSRPCHRTCGWCRNGLPAIGPRRHQELMDLALFRRIVDELGQLGYAGRLILHHHTEPLRNRRLLDEIRHLRVAMPEAEPAIRTPGDLLDHAMFRRLIRAGLGHLQVIRYPRRADTPPSYAVVQAWLRRTGLLGRYPWRLRPVESGALAAVLDLADFHAEVVSPVVRGGPPRTETRAGFGAKVRTRPCQWTSVHAMIDCQGRLKMCQHVQPQLPAHAGYLVGDLRTAGFAELWWSERMTSFRAAHRAADWSLTPLCTGCGDVSP